MGIATTTTGPHALPPGGVPAARALLRSLAYEDDPLNPLSGAVPPAALARWLIAAGLGPLAFRRYQQVAPDLTAQLAGDYYSAVAETAIYQQQLPRVAGALHDAALAVTLLKGAALSCGVYDHPADRVMSDIDFWVHPGDMAAAFAVMQELGFQAAGKAHRPPALQQLSQGEIQLHSDGVLVELHWSPFAGWWLQRTTAIDDNAVWSRREPLSGTDGTTSIYQLGPEDTILHLAIHLAVNHQFGLYPFRTLVDIARTARRRPVDWELVARTARQWCVATATWCTLSLLDELIGVDGMASALAALRPHALRRRLLAPLVNAERLLAGHQPHRSRARYLLLLLLVDRPRDSARLIYRTLWPEDSWLAARYQGRTSRPRHLWNVLRHGRI
jgi:hypothetical protein